MSRILVLATVVVATMPWAAERASAQSAELATDSVQGSSGERAFRPDDLHSVGDRVVFHSSVDGQDSIWSTDGTAAGTGHLFDPCSPSGCSSHALTLGTVGGVSFLSSERAVFATDGTRAGSQWLFDARASTVTTDGARVVGADATAQPQFHWLDIATGEQTSLPIETNGVPHFRILPVAPRGVATLWCRPEIYSECDSGEIWFSDGSEPGTYRVLAAPALGFWMALVGDNVVTTDVSGTNVDLLGIDISQPEQPTLLAAVPPSRTIEGIFETEERIVFSLGFSSDFEVLSTDGTAFGTSYLNAGNRKPFALLGSHLYAHDRTSTLPNVVRIDLQNPSEWQAVFSSGEFEVHWFQELGDLDLFSTNYGLWAIGDNGSTELLFAHDYDTDATIARGEVYYVTSEGLWRSDGTRGGTRFVSEHPDGRRLRTDVAWLSAELIVAAWPGGLYRVVPGVSSAAVPFLPLSEDGMHSAGLLFGANHRAFVHPSSADQPRILISASGPSDVETFALDSFGCEWPYSDLLGVGSNSRADSNAGPGFILLPCRGDPGSLIATDGTSSATMEVATGDFGSYQAIGEVVGLGSKLVFEVDRRPADRNLWVSDGTPEGTQPILPSDGAVSLLQTAGEWVYFFYAADGTNGFQLWRTDGTTEGSEQMSAVGVRFDGESLGHPSWPPQPALGFLEQSVYFNARALGDPDPGLWRVDLDTLNTQRVPLGEFRNSEAYLLVVNGRVLVSNYELHSVDHSDFTVRSLGVFSPSSDAFTTDSFALLSIYDGERAGLVRTDGTAQGTRFLYDSEGRLVENARYFARRPNDHRIFFSGKLGGHGHELLAYDVAADEVRLVHDIYPGGASHPNDLTIVGDKLYFTADDGIHGLELWTLDLDADRCTPSPHALCLDDDNFQVTVALRDFEGNLQRGNTLPLTEDTGAFWFFSPNNIEQLVKVLDGRGINDFHWLFYGALSNVEYYLTATDTRTGASVRYANALGDFASVGDTSAFHEDGPYGSLFKSLGAQPTRGARSHVEPKGSCRTTERVLCLGGRFSVEVAWSDFAGTTGVGTTAPLVEDSGAFWFFSDENLELLVKVLDGTALNGQYWVFYGSLTNVAFDLTVTDEQTGKRVTYSNALGNFASNGDTQAF